jgi:hypothetical protein
MEAIRGDVINKERKNRGDVRMTESPDRGGVEFRTLSYFDVLLDNGTITKPQYEYGRKYWSVRDVAHSEQDIKTGMLKYESDYDQEEMITEDENAEEGMSALIYLELVKRLYKADNDLLGVCCQTLTADDFTNRMAIFRAFGEIALIQAFQALERFMPLAEEAAKIRTENAKNPLRPVLNMLDSEVDTHARNIMNTPA